MNERRRLFELIGLMAALVLIVTTLSIFVFYDAHFEQQRTRLTELVKSQARLIEAVARDEFSNGDGQNAASASATTLAQIRAAQSKFEGIGKSGEFVLAYLKGDTITWLSRRRFGTQDIPAPIPFTGTSLGGPMREALKDRSGSVVGLDYRGIEVLAAHEPVSVLNLGIVAKIDLAEIRAPFVSAGLLFAGIGILIVLITGFLIYRIGQPTIQRLDSVVTALRKSHDEQEQLVEERTAELQSELTMRELIEKSLIGAKKEADEASRSKSEFLANMSHELRTPLNSIIGFSDVLKMEMFGKLGDPKYKDYAGDINRSGTHLLELINEILDVSKIEAGALSLDEQSFDLTQTVDECIAMVAERARLAELEITSAFSDTLPHLIADPLRVKQMILNLLTNSIKFTPKGGRVHISVHAHPEAGMEIEVADTGIGIDEKYLDQVLKPFGQADRDASVTTQEGTGLGLPMVKMLIELHGGSMKLTSTKGQGTQIRLRFSKDRVLL